MGWFSIAAGVCLIVIRFIGNNNEWTPLNIIKVCVGIGMIVFGIIRIMKDNKKTS